MIVFAPLKDKRGIPFPMWFAILEFMIFIVIGLFQKKEFKNVVDFVILKDDNNLHVYNNDTLYLIPYKNITNIKCNTWSKNKFILIEYLNEEGLELSSPFKIMPNPSINLPYLEPKLFKLLKEKIEK